MIAALTPPRDTQQEGNPRLDQVGTSRADLRYAALPVATEWG